MGGDSSQNMVQSDGTGLGFGMADSRYGSFYGKNTAHKVSVPEGWRRTAAVCAIAAVVCVGAVTSLQLQGGSSISLEEEIGSFGTALNSRQNRDTDQIYENTYQNDPGHISRAELRFNAALRAAGGRSGQDVVATSAPEMNMVVAPRLTSSAQWTAFPDPATHHDKLTVNIEEKHTKEAAPRHVGMTAAEARQDLGGYFDSIDHQVKLQERRHAQQILHSLSLTGKQTQARTDSGAGHFSPDTLAARKTQSLMNLVKKAEAGKASNLERLVERAANSKVFQRALVGAAKGNYRGSLAADY